MFNFTWKWNSETRTYLAKRPQAILFGDSLTEYSFGKDGWGAALAHFYARKLDVVNRGFAGYNTKWAELIMEEVFAGRDGSNTLLVMVCLGANDAVMVKSRYKVALPEYVERMRRIVLFIQSKGIKNIFILTPPPINEPALLQAAQAIAKRNGREAPAVPDRTTAYTGEYAKACRELAAELELPVVDLWTEMQRQEDWGPRLFDDGLHFSPAGNQFVYEEILRGIKTSYPNLRSHKLPVHFPNSAFIDPEHPELTFVHNASL